MRTSGHGSAEHARGGRCAELQLQTSPGAKNVLPGLPCTAQTTPCTASEDVQRPLSEVQSEEFKVGMGAFRKRRPLSHQGPVLCTLLPSLWDKNLSIFLRQGLLKSKEEMPGHSCSETVEELRKYS